MGLPVFQVVQRSAAEWRETGGEDEPRVGEVGIGDDAFGDGGPSFLEVGRDELIGELGRGAARGATPELTEKLIAPYLKEAQAVVAEGIVADADLADAGLIFGTGFAPFRGGPLHYLKDRQSHSQV